MVVTKREILTATCWEVSQEVLADVAGGATGLDSEFVWESINAAAQTEPPFYAGEPNDYYRVSADQVADIRAALAREDISGWWDAPMDRRDQRAVRFPDDGEFAFPPEDLLSGLKRWVHDATTMTGDGAWGTLPAGPSVFITTRSLTPLAPAVELVGAEDELGWQRALIYCASEVSENARVYEVGSAEDWIALVDAAPLDVTSSRRSNWGIPDPHARWFMPNWVEIADRYDAVHLTVNAFLDLSCVPLHCGLGQTMIAGWGSDETFWLSRPDVSWDAPYLVHRHGMATWSTESADPSY